MGEAPVAAATTSPGPGLRAWLQQQTDIAHYRPQAVPEAEASKLHGREGPYIVLKNPRTKTYYRLGDRDYFLWQRMDGTRTVKELVVAYFLEYKAFAFARVAGLVQGLRASQLLTDEPLNLYGYMHAQLESRKPGVRLAGIWSAFLGKQFAISKLDGFITAVYRLTGRLLYNRPALVLYILLSVAGLYSFVRAFRTGGWGVVTIGGSLVWGIVGLAVANLFSVLVHEMGHALTVKHYGREVRRGGFLIYFGTPGFFVDTTDIWMEGKRARLAVTWAGPFSGLILAGLASVILIAWPGFPLNPLLFQFAFLTYITVFLNLNPLLELDGYYLLMDAIEIPSLRRKSLEFLRAGLAAKAKGMCQAGKSLKAAVATFSQEERIFAVFGLLSTIWTVYALYMVINLYRVRLAGALQGLWQAGSGLGRFLLGAGSALLSVIIIAGLGMVLWGAVRTLLHSASRRGLLAGWNLAAIFTALALLLTLGPGLVGYGDWLPHLGLGALIAAAALAGWNALDLAGSRLAPAFWLLSGFALALAGSHAVALVAGQGWLEPGPGATLDAILEMAAAVVLTLAGLALLGDVDLKQLAAWERALLVAGLLASHGLALWTVGQQAGRLHPWGLAALVSAGRTVAPLWALVGITLSLASFWRSRLAPAWALLALASAGLLGGALLPRVPAVLPLLFLAAGLWAFHLAFVGSLAGRTQSQDTLALNDPQRLAHAFASVVESLHSEWCTTGGAHGARAALQQLNNYALAAGWHLQVREGKIEDHLPADWTLYRRGEVYGTALTLLLDLMANHVGEKLAVRALQRGYDGLSWDQREVAAQALFPHVRWAAAVSRAFEATRRDYQALLRRMPLFATAEDEELDLVCASLRAERFAPGRTIIRQGERGDRFYIVQRGHVEVLQRDGRGVTEVVERLERGDYFGEVALLNDAPRNATCRATVPTELLSLSRADFERLVMMRFGLRGGVDRSIARVELLRQVPLFAGLDTRQIQTLAARMREERYEPGDVLIRQGDEGETFYVVESGCIETWVSQNGAERLVAERGPGEYVGEIALLMRVPRTATVRASTALQVLALDREEFDQLVASHLFVSRGLETEASRRMLHLREVARIA
jgi:putative peptide zinc metalloprotease protein